MHQIFQILAQVAQWCASSPANMQMTYALLMGAKRGYESLSPATKAKVDSIMIRAAEYLVKAAVGDVLGWARSEAVTLGLNSDAATVAEVGVRRVAEVGLSKAFEEMGRPAGNSKNSIGGTRWTIINPANAAIMIVWYFDGGGLFWMENGPDEKTPGTWEQRGSSITVTRELQGYNSTKVLINCAGVISEAGDRMSLTGVHRSAGYESRFEVVLRRV